jgi:hypothetical protein
MLRVAVEVKPLLAEHLSGALGAVFFALDVKVFEVQTRSTPEFEAEERRPKVA